MSHSDADFESSDNLANLDAEIERITERLGELQTERGEAVQDRASGTEGAAQRLQELHTEQERLERELEDARAARQYEAQRLQCLHSDAVRAAQEARRQNLEAHRQSVYKTAQNVDKKLSELLNALKSLERDARAMQQQHLGWGGGSLLPATALEAVKNRLDIEAESEAAKGPRIADRVIDSESFIDQAHMPDTLEGLHEVGEG